MPGRPKNIDPRELLAFVKTSVLPLLVAAILVAALNIVKFLLPRFGVTIPESLKTVEEIGEFVLAVFVILVMLGIQHRQKLIELGKAPWKKQERKG